MTAGRRRTRGVAAVDQVLHPDMSPQLTLSAESAASVEQVHSAFGYEEYWLARIAAFDGNASLESLTVDTDGTVTVRTVADLTRNRLPGMVTKLIPGDLTLMQNEIWKPIGDGRVSGQLNFAVLGGLGSGHATALLVPVPNGSRLNFAVTVKAKVPVLARKIEDYFGNQFAEQIPVVQRFTTAWICERAGT